jgi:NAD-dependent deacetylase
MPAVVVTSDSDVKFLSARISDMRKVLILTGAGVSRASGLSTYRGEGGLYQDSAIEALHHADRLPDSLLELWAFWGPRRCTIAEARPNAAHDAIAAFQLTSTLEGREVTLATQNVDDLHERAGSAQVAHLHGRLMTTRCLDDTCSHGVHEDATPYDAPPPCPVCGLPLRPALVLFGEAQDVEAQWTARRAVRDCDLLLAVGTSLDVSTANALVRYAVDVGARVVTVDPAPAVSPMFDVHVPMPAEDVLPRLLR